MKRIVSLVLVLAMIISPCLTSCVSTSGGSSEHATEAATIREGVTHTEPHNVPKYDFDGENFHSLYFIEGTIPNFYATDTATYYYFTDDEAAGDPIKEALWKRTELVAEHLNVTFSHETYEGLDMTMLLYGDVMADLDTYQQIMPHCVNNVASMVEYNYLYDFAALPYVNLEADWWDLEAMEMLRLGKSYPYGRSDYIIAAPHVITFNKTMIRDLNLDDPYELVLNYEWTLDRMLEMTRAAVLDVHGDGIFRGDEDIFGICTSEISKFNSFLTSCNQPVSKKNSEGKLEIVINCEKTVKIIEKFAELSKVRGAVHIDMYDNSVYMDKIFSEGRCLFALFDPSFLESQRNAEIDYGILPYPMYDEEQSEYRSEDWGLLWAIPKQIRNPKLVGSVVELLSYYSRDTMIPAYYDKVLDGKLANDLQSRKMLDIIFDCVVFEPINNYFGFTSKVGSLAFVIGYLALEGSTDFASYYREREHIAKNVLRDFYGQLKQHGDF